MVSIFARARSGPAALLIHHIQDARALRLPQTQIFVAARSQAVQMAEQPVPGARIVAVAFPDNGDGGHGLLVPRKDDGAEKGAHCPC